MRKSWNWTLALLCALLLSACGGGTDQAVWTSDHVQDILNSGAFSEELETLDCDTAWMLYGLAETGLEREQLVSGEIYRSAGATCEELTVLSFDSEDAAKTAADALETYVQSQIEANRDYRPAEIPKLEHNWLERRGATVLLAVANEPETAHAAVEPDP